MNVQAYRAAEKRHWDYYNLAPEETFLELGSLNNVKVRVQEVGQGEPVLFVHGGPNAGTTWASIVAQLQDFRCIVLDRPGSGLSEPVDITRLDIREFGADLLSSVLDGLGIEKAAIVASSFGGALALFFAAARPERVTRMVQQGCPAFVEGMLMPFFMRMLAINPIGKFIASQQSTMASTTMVMRQIGHGKSIDAERIPSVMMDWYIQLMNDTDTMRNELKNIQHAGGWRGFRPEYTYGAELLGRIPHPTLFLWGEDDAFGGLDVAQRAVASMPNASLRSFPDQGHLPWLDDPDTNARLVCEFLRNGKAYGEQND
jgi:pimeloyl-ACP methyl ester carboxylesterase